MPHMSHYEMLKNGLNYAKRLGIEFARVLFAAQQLHGIRVNLRHLTFHRLFERFSCITFESYKKRITRTVHRPSPIASDWSRSEFLIG
ncbi:hypothetical protein JOB18_005385 [Solea senegalensis]|uniref:Uncharacterized protein n=1 Tax=Solea senegalensis TaxID=28829 RepID=A0AAV6QGI7_SOLSE|nr:hypothetical protein JOB18_005385 [Solea senegalensis]